MKSNCENSCLLCDQRSDIFNTLTDSELEYLSKVKNTVYFQPGELILKQGIKMSSVISFVSGLCKITISRSNGESILLRLIKPPEFISPAGLYFDGASHFNIFAIEEAKICFIDLAAFKDILNKNKDFSCKYMGIQNQNYALTLSKLISLNKKNREARIAEVLLYLSDEIFENDVFKIPLNKQELSEMLAMSKSSIYSLLEQMHNDKLIETSNNSIKILNKAKLKLISELG